MDVRQIRKNLAGRRFPFGQSPLNVNIMSRDVSPSSAGEPDPGRMREIWNAASPFWRLELPPEDDDVVLVDPSVWDDVPG